MMSSLELSATLIDCHQSEVADCTAPLRMHLLAPIPIFMASGQLTGPADQLKRTLDYDLGSR